MRRTFHRAFTRGSVNPLSKLTLGLQLTRGDNAFNWKAYCRSQRNRKSAENLEPTPSRYQKALTARCCLC